MIGDEHEGPGVQPRMDAAGCVGQDQDRDTQAGYDPNAMIEVMQILEKLQAIR